MYLASHENYKSKIDKKILFSKYLNYFIYSPLFVTFHWRNGLLSIVIIVNISWK